MEGTLKIFGTYSKSEEIISIFLVFCADTDIYAVAIMLSWGVLNCGVPESVWFGIGDFPIYKFFIPTHLYHVVTNLLIERVV